MPSSHSRSVSVAAVGAALLASLGAPGRPALGQTTFELVKSFAERPAVKAPLVVGSDGALYGVMSQGGGYGRGGVFKVTGLGTYTLLHSFSGPDGEHPSAALVLAGDSALYGSTTSGGAFGHGTIFRVNSAGMFSLLHSFGVAGGPPRNALT